MFLFAAELPMLTSLLATRLLDVSYAPLTSIDPHIMDKHADHIEESAITSERGIELENLSSDGGDDRDIIRLGKKPVLKVRTMVARCLAPTDQTTVAQLWLHVHIGLQLHSLDHLGGLLGVCA